jgi:hypothetical protein
VRTRREEGEVRETAGQKSKIYLNLSHGGEQKKGGKSTTFQWLLTSIPLN